MRTGGILGSIWAVHLFPGAPGVHPLNLGHLHQHRVWFLHVTWICSSQREPTWHCDLVHKIWQRNHSLEYVVHHAIQMMKKNFVRSGKKWQCGKWKIYVHFFMWSYNWDSEISLLRLFLPHFRDHSIPLIPCNCISWSFPVLEPATTTIGNLSNSWMICRKTEVFAL